MKNCSIIKCGRKAISKNLCNKHYYQDYRLTHPRKYMRKTHPCSFDGCQQRTSLSKIHCSLHTPKIKIPDGRTGERAWNWKGGVSHYKNQRLMQKQRAYLLHIHKNKCQECGDKKYERNLNVHHIDGGTENHAIDNLILLCRKCHFAKHKGRMNNSKFAKLYGLSSTFIAKKFNISVVNVFTMHNFGLLEKFLKRNM